MTTKKNLARTGRAKKASAPQHAASTCAGCARVEYRLNTLIAWMAASSNGPISFDEARRLLSEIGNE